jgi:hypothetical protein
MVTGAGIEPAARALKGHSGEQKHGKNARFTQ